MKLTILSHNLSSNAAMRAHRLAKAAGTFADVALIGPVEKQGPWPALPQEGWIRTMRKARFPEFFASFQELVQAADGDVLIAVKPHLASFGAALVAGELREIPVILDIDDLDVAGAPRAQWAANPTMADLARPNAAVYVALLTKAVAGAAAITVVSTALQRRFGGELVSHGCITELFDPTQVDRESARRAFGFAGPTVLFPGTPRAHKGLGSLARAVHEIPGARLAVLCRPSDLAGPEWERFPLIRIPFLPYAALPPLLAAADVIAIPQSDTEFARYQMPMKLFDAMAMGKPIVASAVSDIPLALEGCGRLVPPDDVGALAAAIVDVLRDPVGAAMLGQRARERCLAQYSIAQIGARLFEVVSRAQRAA
jgi:glycosyltransferase involved in cell wall biosynthesis